MHVGGKKNLCRHKILYRVHQAVAHCVLIDALSSAVPHPELTYLQSAPVSMCKNMHSLLQFCCTMIASPAICSINAVVAT